MESLDEKGCSPLRPKDVLMKHVKSLYLIFKGEDHTLGNALRFIISNYSDIKFCAYTIPHPAEPKMVLQIQTHGIPAVDILRRGLQDLGEFCDFTIEAFEEAMQETTPTS